MHDLEQLTGQRAPAEVDERDPPRLGLLENESEECSDADRRRAGSRRVVWGDRDDTAPEGGGGESASFCREKTLTPAIHPARAALRIQDENGRGGEHHDRIGERSGDGKRVR